MQNGTLKKNGGDFDGQGGFVSANLADGASPAGLVKTGSGTLTLTGDNTYSGGTTLCEGQLSIGSPTALGTGTFTIGGAGPCEIVAPSGVYVTLSNNNPMVWNGDFTFGHGPSLNLGTGPVTSGNNPLSTTGAITITGGTLDLGGNSQVTSGNVIIRGGNLQNGVLQTSGNLIIDGGNIQDGILRKSGGNFDARAGTISAVLADGASAAGLYKNGTGSLILSGANMYTGGTLVMSGTLLATRPAALPGYNTPEKVKVITPDSTATLAVSYGGGADWSSSDVDTLLANATFLTNSMSRVAYLGFDTTNATAGAMYGGPITGHLGVSKLGANSLTLSGSNTYIHGTRVREGTLILDGGDTSVTGLGLVVVSPGATLSGSGIIAGQLTVAGILSPGDSSGVLTVNSRVTFQTGATFEVDVDGLAAGTQYDQLVATREVALAGSLVVRFGTFAPTGHDMLFVVNNMGSHDTTGVFQYTDDLYIGTFNGYDWHVTYDANYGVAPSLDGGNDVAIYSVPEPSPIILLSMAAAYLLAYVCRPQKGTV